MKLLLIDSRLKSLETFIQGCNESTYHVVYDIQDSFDELKQKIQNLGVSSFNNIGFVFEDEGSFKLFVSYNAFVSFDDTGVHENLTTQFIKELVDTYNIQTLDFLACELLLNPTWKSYFEYLQTQNSTLEKTLVVRASSNKSGNLQHGGDWILESTNEDISALYFNENIGEWSHLLDLFTTNKYGVFLSSETVDNIYTSGFNDNNLLLRGYTYTNANALFAKNIVSVSCSTAEIGILTDELSNNLYVYGYNSYGVLGLNNTSEVKTITICNSPNIVNKKVVHVEFYKGGGSMFVLTDESLNNLYAGGRGGTLGLPNTTNYSTLQQITYLNKKINMISISDINNQIGLLTDDLNNNLYLAGYEVNGSWGNGGVTNSSSNIFVNIDISNITTSKLIYLECGIGRTAFLTDEISNNFYISGSATSGAIGTGETSGSRTTFVNVALTAGLNEPLINTTPILNKKIVKVFMNKTTNQKQICAILTNETTNNLYVCGNVSNGYMGSNDTSLKYFKNISENINGKKIVNLMLTGSNTSTILTDESLNNIYSSGISLYNGSTSGLFNPGEIVLQYTNIASLSHSKELFNKNVKYMGSSDYLTLVVTDDNAIYNCGLTKHSSNAYYINLRNDWMSYNKMDSIGKKFIDFNALNNYILTISTESSNNLYICGKNTSIFSDSSNNYPKLVNLSLKQSALLNKKVIGLCSSDVTSFVITNESSNNLYACGGVLNSVPIGNGTLNVSTTFINITSNIENKKIIYVSCSDEHSSILTDESVNNLYLCGKNSFGQLGNNTVDTLTTFTNITTNIENKKILKVDSLCKKKTFLIADEVSNNLYACGSGRLGNNINTNFQKTFININNNNLLNKKIIDLCSENTNENVGVLTSIDFTPEIYIEPPAHISFAGSASSSALGNFTSAIAYSNKLNKLIVGSYTSSTYMMSSDKGSQSSWSSQTINNTSSNVSKNKSCVWSPEKELFCMVREYTSNNNPRISTSSDGVNWSHISTSSDNVSSFSLHSVIWSLQLGLFCACGSGDRILTSPNGIQWTERIISSGYMYTSVTWSKELNLLCAIGVKQNCTTGSIIATSSDGVNWNTYSTTIMNDYIWSKSASVTWSSTLNKFCGITFHAPEVSYNTFTYNLGIHISSNGTNWTSTYLQLSTIAPELFIHAFKYDPHNISILYVHNKFILSGFNRMCLLSDDGLNWTKKAFSSPSTGSNGYGIVYIEEINQIFCTLSTGYTLRPFLSNNFYYLGIGDQCGSPINTNANLFMNMFPYSINSKKFINISIGKSFTKLISNESDNNVYFAGNNNYGQLGNGTLYGSFQFAPPKLNIPLKSIVYVPPVTVAPIIISSNSQTSSVKYMPKTVTIGNNNQIFFPDPTKTSIEIAPAKTTEAVQKYESVLNVSAKNVVSGYIKLEPAGTTFQNHISLEFNVDPFIQPVVYFKSSNDTSPLLIPSSNNSSNDVYYTANTSTGAVTLYTNHFSEAIVTQDQGTINPPVGFVLSKFNTLLAMGVSGELFKEAIPAMDVSGIAEYYVNASDMRNVFVFQTDSKDINNISNEDVKYFVRKNQWPQGLVLNPCHAWVQVSNQIASSDKSGLIPDDKQLVKHDFIRYIAKSMFNTHLGVDLFQNESELKYDLAYKGHNSAWTSIWDSITSISDVSLNTTTYSGKYGTDASYGYYLTNDLSNNSNICRQLLGQVASTAPGRMQNITTYAIDLSNGYYSVPLIDGDSISFKLTLQTAPNQHLLLNSATPIQPRSYQIRVNLRDTVTRGTTHQNGTNLIVNDPLPTTYIGTVPTDTLNTSYPANYV